jgi:hypothetical protein
MRRAKIVLSDQWGVSRGTHSKQFVADLHERGFARDEAIASLCLAFGISRGAAKLFVDSHPAWADEIESNESD